MSQKHALLIGNGTYKIKGIENLEKSARNVEDLAAALCDPHIGGFAAHNVETVLNAGDEHVCQKITEFFAQKDRADTVLLYFTGHGFRDKGGELHLAVQNTDKDALDRTAIPASFIATQMAQSRIKRQVILLDCCFSGAFKPPLKLTAPGVTSAVVLTASDATEFAWEDDPKLARSLFTHHLILGLQNGKRTVDELYDYVRTALANTKQKPQRLIPFDRHEEDVIIASPKSPPQIDPALLHGHHFICYAPTDGAEFALQLYDALRGAGEPVWLDRRDAHEGQSGDAQVTEALQTCASLLFVATPDSVRNHAGCAAEWRLALKYKKPVVPIRPDAAVNLPLGLANRAALSFDAADFAASVARLRAHLRRLDTPEGRLQQLRYRRADAERELGTVRDARQEARIHDDIAQLDREIVAQERVVRDPRAAAKRVAQSIERGLERERQPDHPTSGAARSKFINPLPDIVPRYFQDRYVETKCVADFLRDEAQRMLTIIGRAGIGKTALVCRLLRHLERGALPDELGDLRVGGIVYLSAVGTRRITFANLFADLSELLSPEVAARLETLYRDPQTDAGAKMRALLAEFPARRGDEDPKGFRNPSGLVVVLLDNFEDMVEMETRAVADAELDAALRAVLTAPPHAVKVLMTTRLAPRDLTLCCPQHQAAPLHIDNGLESPYAENVLREQDSDGKLGLRDAPDDLLKQAKERMCGYPRALEALGAILKADRDTSLEEILAIAEDYLPENVVEKMVGDAYNRLDAAAQRVMQALAIYARPVTPTATDFLLAPHTPGLDTAPVLKRLVNMHLARKEAGKYYLHPVDRDYALARIPTLTPGGSKSPLPSGERARVRGDSSLTERVAELTGRGEQVPSPLWGEG